MCFGFGMSGFVSWLVWVFRCLIYSFVFYGFEFYCGFCVCVGLGRFVVLF